MATPGKVENYAHQQPGTTTAKLYNFEIGKFDLKPEHSSFLINVVAPILRKGGGLYVTGLASRTGTQVANQKLSENRSKAVIALLRGHVTNNFQVTAEFAMGELAAAFAGVSDGVEQENWRAVVISVWDKPVPPPAPQPPQKTTPPKQKSDEHRFNKRWMGIGAKAGGQLLFGGVESAAAKMWCLGNGESFNLEIISGRFGIGLGGSGGAVAVIGFGFSIPYELHGKKSNDWGLSVALTQKFISKSTLQSIRNAKIFLDTLDAAGNYVAATRTAAQAFKLAEILQHLRNSLHTVYQGLETAKQSGIIVIDLPLAGAGLELSVYATRGTMYVSNPSQWIGPDPS